MLDRSHGRARIDPLCNRVVRQLCDLSEVAISPHLFVVKIDTKDIRSANYRPRCLRNTKVEYSDTWNNQAGKKSGVFVHIHEAR